MRSVKVAEGITNPNGITLSRDERTLYVNDTRGEYLVAMDVLPDGKVDLTGPWVGGGVCANAPDVQRIDPAAAAAIRTKWLAFISISICLSVVERYLDTDPYKKRAWSSAS